MRVANEQFDVGTRIRVTRSRHRPRIATAAARAYVSAAVVVLLLIGILGRRDLDEKIRFFQRVNNGVAWPADDRIVNDLEWSVAPGDVS